MAVSSVDTLSGPYTTNGVTTTFPFTFKAMAEGEVRVFRIASTGIETEIGSGSYDVTLGEDGGSVVFTVAPAAGDPLYIGTDPDFTQQITFENQGAFLPEVMNEAFDRAAIRDLAIKRDLDRAIRVPLGEESAILPPIADRTLKYLGFDAAGLPIATDAVVDLVANEALGISVGEQDMGTTPGTILSDNGTAKDWFQESEAAIEERPTSAALSASTGGDSLGSKRAALLTAAEYRTLTERGNDRFDFRDMLGADLTGANDMASTLSTAAAHAASAGDVLHLPLGVITLASTLTIASGVRLCGVGNRPYTSLADGGSRGPGSWLHFAHTGVGIAYIDGGSFPTGTVLERMGTFRDQPVVGSGWSPTAHDFDITNTGGRILLRDFCFLNPTKALRQLSGGAGHFQLERVCGQPFDVGVQIDSGYEGFTVNALRWWPYWTNDIHTRAYTLANRRGMYLRHCDNPYVNGYFDFGSKYHLFVGSHTNGVVNNANFVNPEFDNFGGTAVFVEAGSDASHIKLIGGYSYGLNETGSAIEVNANNTNIHAIGHRFQNLQRRAAILNGTGNTLTVTDPEVTNWNIINGGDEAFAATSGNRIFLDGEVKRSGGNGAAIINNVGLIASEEYTTITGLAVTAQTGTITTASANCRIQRKARRVSGKFSVTVTTNGTGAADLRVALPVIVAAGQSFYSSGRNVSTGAQVQVVVNSGLAVITTPTNTYPIATGQTIEFNADYECVAL